MFLVSAPSLVESGGFTRAADSLDVPLATISKQVRELEAHLGVRLLQRTTRRVTVTPEGQDYYAKSTRVLRDLEDIDASFNLARGKPGGHLRIDVGGSTARDVLIPLLPDFVSRYPDIRIDLGVSDRAVPFRFERDGDRIEIKVEHRMGVNESNAHLAACVAGLGIVQTFDYAAEASLRDGSLVEILKPWRPAPYPFHVVYPQSRHLTHRLRVFIDWLLECFPARLAAIK